MNLGSKQAVRQAAGILLAATAVVSILVGCGTKVAPAVQKSATFTYVSVEPIIQGGWDPATEYSWEVLVMPDMYEGLTRYDPTTRKVLPLLATSWTSANHGTLWTFTLRRNVTFHTGRPFTSSAAKAAIERTSKLGQAAAYIWSPIKEIDTPDPHTLVLKLRYPAPMDLVAAATYSAWMYDTQAAGSGNLTTWFAKGRDAGTGPYTVASWTKGAEFELRLKAYPQYWGGWSGSHYRDLVFRVVPSASTAMQLLESGQVTFVAQPAPQDFASLRANPSLKTSVSSSFENEFLMLNTLRPPLSDVRVRQALAYAVNYGGIAAVLHGAVERTSGVLPPGVLGYTTDLPNYSYDPAKAASLLKSAGYGPGGKPIDLTLTYITGDPIEGPVAELAKSSFTPLNVHVNLEPLQFPALLAKTQGPLAQRQDITIYSWYPDYPDAETWFKNLFGTQKPIGFNASYYSNPQLDAEMQQAEQETATNPSAAAALYRQMQLTILHDVPAICFATLIYQRAMLSSVHGYHDNPLYTNAVFAYYLTP